MKRIAFIDNSQELRDLIPLILDADDVKTFENGPLFLKHFQPGMFGLVVTDILLPEMNGYKVLQHIRRIDDHVPVIAFTAIAYEKERQQALAAGFSEYVIKPVLDWDAFIRKVKVLSRPLQKQASAVGETGASCAHQVIA